MEEQKILLVAILKAILYFPRDQSIYGIILRSIGTMLSADRRL